MQQTPSHGAAAPAPMRRIWLGVLLAVVLAVAMDLHGFVANGTPITALRTPALGSAEDGSVDAFCGFAPCGMPLECN